MHFCDLFVKISSLRIRLIIRQVSVYLGHVMAGGGGVCCGGVSLKQPTRHLSSVCPVRRPEKCRLPTANSWVPFITTKHTWHNSSACTTLMPRGFMIEHPEGRLSWLLLLLLLSSPEPELVVRTHASNPPCRGLIMGFRITKASPADELR
jgi:hypothetical protein